MLPGPWARFFRHFHKTSNFIGGQRAKQNFGRPFGAPTLPFPSFLSTPTPKFSLLSLLNTTDYIYIVDLKKKSCRLPPARLLSPDRADMDCGIDSLSSQLPPHHSFEVNLWGIDSRNFLSFCSRKVLKTDLES